MPPARRATSSAPPPPSDQVERWVVIEDFSPGCQSFRDGPVSNFGPVPPTTSFGTFAPVSEPGVADPALTLDAWCDPITRHLCRMPWKWTSFYPTILAPSGTHINLVGLHVSPFPLDATAALTGGSPYSGFQLFYAVDWITTTPQHAQAVNRIVFASGSTVLVDGLFNQLGAVPAVFQATPISLANFRAAITGSPTAIGTPGTVFTGLFAESNVGFTKMFPNPAAVTTNTPVDVIGGGAGQRIVGHQSRAVRFAGSAGAISQQGKAGGVSNVFAMGNDTIQWSQPNQLPADGGTSTFSTEYPGYYGAIGSSNSSELILVRSIGGALIVTGDLNNPFITQYSDVDGTHGIVCDPCFSSLGMIYGQHNGGIYAYSGGQASRNIAEKLAPGFWEPPENLQDPIGYGTPSTLTVVGRYKGQFAYSKGFLFVPNQYIYDVLQKSWWPFNRDTLNGGTFPLTMFRHAHDGTVFGAAQSQNPGPPAAFDIEVGQYNPQPVGVGYQWGSLPIPLATGLDKAELRKVAVTAYMNAPDTATRTGTVLVQLGDTNGTFISLGVMTVTNHASINTPQTQVFNVPSSFMKLQNVVVSLQVNPSTATDYAPVVANVQLGLGTTTKFAG